MSRADRRRAKTSIALRKSCEAGATMSSSRACRDGIECMVICALSNKSTPDTLPSADRVRTTGTPIGLKPLAFAAAINSPPSTVASRNCMTGTPRNSAVRWLCELSKDHRRSRYPPHGGAGGTAGLWPAPPPPRPPPAVPAAPAPPPAPGWPAVFGWFAGRGAFGAGIDAAIERSPFGPTARTPAHSSSNCRLSEQDVTLPSGMICSQVADVVRRTSSS